MYEGKNKLLTFSYDDGISQDKRLVEIFNKYGLKGTFNINSGRFGKSYPYIMEHKTVDRTVINKSEVPEIYKGHEVACHATDHQNLFELSDSELIDALEGDRLALSEIVGYDVCGMAYPCGRYDERILRVLKEKTGIKYARTVISTGTFELQKDSLLTFNPTTRHCEFDDLFRLGEEFLKSNPSSPSLFYIWGHSYEFDFYDTWDKMDDFCRMMSGKDDIFYCTNRQAFCL